MSEYHVRLDDFGRNVSDGSSYSTVIIAEYWHKNQSLHWGHASNRGQTSPIVTLKWGFIEITVDESVIGKPKLQVLHDTFHGSKGSPLREPPDPETRRQAAFAAYDAEDYKLTAEIDPDVLFEEIARAIVDKYAASLNGEAVTKLIEKFNRHVDSVRMEGFTAGQGAARSELRSWLGGGSFDKNR